MTPIDYYQNQCLAGNIEEDPEQRRILACLQTIYTDLIAEHKQRSKRLAVLRKPKRVKGLYLWGGVGVGKTFLMDCFYHCIPFAAKKRRHFHQFMHWVHAELKKQQGKKNPLQIIAKELAKETLVICFDEFFVTDIADAMILARLFKALFAHGVCLVATSNTAPDNLYKHGLQRSLFLPAIAMIHQHTHVIHILSENDYRMRQLKQSGVFFTPHDHAAEASMEKSFHLLADGASVHTHPITLHDREIKIIKRTRHIIWFDFAAICHVPRSQHDYLAIAKQYHTVMISNIPVIAADANNTISLFIKLIDVLYDQRIRLIFSAATTIDQIYSAGYLSADFARTRSRLIEMQSESYFAHEN